MTAGKYSLIRCMPDPIRGEVFNVGVVAWDDEQFRITIDEQAAKRAVNQGRSLASDAWLQFEESIRSQLIESDKLNLGNLERLANLPPVDRLIVSKPVYVKFGDEDDSFAERVDAIVARMVRPRSFGGKSGSPVEDVKRHIQPMLKSGRVHTSWQFARSRTGKKRFADFYLNSGADIALDAVRADYEREAEASRAVDAEAFKVDDIKRAEDSVRYVVYLRCQYDGSRDDFNEESIAILRNAGAEVVRSVDDAVKVFEHRVKPRLHLVAPVDSTDPDDRRRTSGS